MAAAAAAAASLASSAYPTPPASAGASSTKALPDFLFHKTLSYFSGPERCNYLIIYKKFEEVVLYKRASDLIAAKPRWIECRPYIKPDDPAERMKLALELVKRGDYTTSLRLVRGLEEVFSPDGHYVKTIRSPELPTLIAAILAITMRDNTAMEAVRGFRETRRFIGGRASQMLAEAYAYQGKIDVALEIYRDFEDPLFSGHPRFQMDGLFPSLPSLWRERLEIHSAYLTYLATSDMEEAARALEAIPNTILRGMIRERTEANLMERSPDPALATQFMRATLHVPIDPLVLPERK